MRRRFHRPTPVFLALVIAAMILGIAPSPTLAEECGWISVSAEDLHFGLYDPGSGLAAESVSTLEVSCSGLGAGLTQFDIRLDSASAGAASGPGLRSLRHGSSELHYELYLDPGRTRAWGAASSRGGAAQGAVESESTTTLDVYGRIPGGQNVPPGSYADSITVTIYF